LNNRCVKLCHNAKKEKANYQLEEENGILKGGEGRRGIAPAIRKTVLLYARLILPLEHEDHMPPKDKDPALQGGDRNYKNLA